VGVVRSYLRADRRGVIRDGVLIMLAGSVPLVAVAGRVASTAGVSWVRQRHGVDLGAYLPIVWVVLLVAHTPIMLGTLTGLLMLEDRDAGVLPAIATTRASVGALLRYRLTATAVLTAAALAIGFVVAGVDHPAGIVGSAAVIVAAAALSPVPAMLMAAFARNRVQGIAVMKIIGLPLYLPVASWFVDVPARWLFAPLPSSWTIWSMWAVTPASALAFATGAIVVCSVATVALSHRFVRGASRT
jgi:fluoroquinolone transport system permease protein